MSDKPSVSQWKIVAVLIGFPLISFLLSLLLLEKKWFIELGLDFFGTFWIIISCWYIIQIGLLFFTLKTSNMSLRDIGYSFDLRRTIWLVIAYFSFAFALLALVESALAEANLSIEDINSLSDFSNITPKTTGQRIIFIFAGLVAGIAEEFVYRGFAIHSLESYKINKWMTIMIAAIPFVFQHGLKSIDQFWWFFSSGLVLGIIFLLTKRKLYVNIIIHWLIILSAIPAILQLLDN